jgi:hypothetical protein
VTRFRVGLMDSVLAARPTGDAFSRANYLAAVANRADSYWVPDHINGQTPRAQAAVTYGVMTVRLTGSAAAWRL